jgi:hypothetical protein
MAAPAGVCEGRQHTGIQDLWIDFTDDSNGEYYLDKSGNGNHAMKFDPEAIEPPTTFTIPGQGMTFLSRDDTG